MVDWLKSVFEIFKLKPKHLIALGTTCLVIIMAPKNCRDFLGYDKLISPYRGWISLAGLALLLYGSILVFAGYKTWIVKKWNNWLFKRKAPGKLKQLADDEKKYLAEYLKYNVSSLYFRMSNGVINSLIHSKIIYSGANMTIKDDVLAYNLQPWAQKILKNDQDLADDIKRFASDHVLCENKEYMGKFYKHGNII